MQLNQYIQNQTVQFVIYTVLQQLTFMQITKLFKRFQSTNKEIFSLWRNIKMEIKIDQDSEAKEVADLQKPSEESSKCKSQYKKGWSLDDLHRSKEHPQLLRSLMRRLSEEEISLVYQAYRDMYPTTAKLQVIWHDFKQGKFQRDYMREIQDVIYPLADVWDKKIAFPISFPPKMFKKNLKGLLFPQNHLQKGKPHLESHA